MKSGFEAENYRLERLRYLKQLKDENAASTANAELSLYEFTKQAWHIIEPATEFIGGWHLEVICDHLQACTRRQIRNLIINIPPRCMKSIALAVMWPCWSWISHPETRWMFASYSLNLSIRDNVKSRSVIESDWFRERWGDRFEMRDDQNAKSRYENSKTGFRLATSVDSMATGEGGDFLCCDDPHNAKYAESDAVRQSALDWWDRTMTTRGNDPKTVVKVVVMQRLHEKDLTGHLLEQGGWEHLMLPMEYEPGRATVTSLGVPDPRKEEGELLWPARFGDPEVLALKSSLGSYGVAGQFQQRPSPPEGGLFGKSRFCYFTVERLPASVDGSQPDVIITLFGRDGITKRVLGSQCLWFQTCDTAMVASQEADYTAIGTFLLTPDNDLLIWDVWRDKIEVPAQYDTLIAHRNRYPQLLFQAVEDRSSGTGLIQTGRIRGTPFKALRAAGSKIQRAVAVSTMYENGQVYHKQGDPYVCDFENELSTFPNAAHDDQVDVVSYAGLLVISGELRANRLGRPLLAVAAGPPEYDRTNLGVPKNQPPAPTTQELVGSMLRDMLED